MSEENRTPVELEDVENAVSIEDALKDSSIDEDTATPEDVQSEESETSEGESAEESSEDESENKEEAEQKKGKKNKKTARQRINELTFGKREAERLAEKAAEEAEYWKSQATNQSAGSAVGDTRPVPENYSTVEEYEDSLYEWRRNKELSEQREKAEKAHVERITALFQANSERVRSEHPDFDKVVEAPVFSPVMKRQIYESEYGPEIGYFLGLPDNQAFAQQIGQLPPERQIAEIAKLEVRLSEARPLKTTNATPPIKPVGNSGVRKRDDNELSTEERIKKLRAERLAKLKGK